jgi:hypothetical protein
MSEYSCFVLQDALVAAQSYRDKNSAGDKSKSSGFEVGSTLADDKSAQVHTISLFA